MNNSKFKNLVFFALMFLIFFQLLTTFIESIYVLCLLKLELTNDLLWLLIFLSPLVSIALSKKHIVSRLNICVLVIVLSRVTMNFFNPDIKLIISGVGVGTFLVMLPYFFKWLAEAEILPLNTFIASGFALFFLTVFKSLGASFDVTENKYLGLVFLAVPILGFKLIDTSTKAISKTKTHSKITTASTLLGISAIFILLYFTFSSPVVMYRWSHLNSYLVLALYLTPLFFLAYSVLTKQHNIIQFIYKHVLLITLVFSIALIVTLIFKQINPFQNYYDFPITLVDTWYHNVPLIIVLCLWPILLFDLEILVKKFKTINVFSNSIGVWVITCFSLVLIVHVLGHIFTTTWGYVPLVGAYFRDTLWLLHALPCLLLLIALIIDKKQTVSLEQSSLSIKKSSLLIVLSVFALGIFSIVYMTSAKPQVNEQTKPLKIVTFNMQQGRDINGFKAHDKQLELIKSLNPDIIGLQESGPLRVSGGNVDVVRYLADKLNYYSYYGASPITGTYGIALLSRFPIEQPKTHFLSSDYEQIATIVAKIKIRGVYYTVSVNHPAGNNYFKMKQVKETLSFLETENPVICMGDFNFVEGSDCYKEMTNSFKDSWNQGKKDIVPKERCSTIDHIFVSKHINVLNSHCIKTTYSDHNLVYTEIQTVEYL